MSRGLKGNIEETEVLWGTMTIEDRVKALPEWRGLDLRCKLRKDCPGMAKFCQFYCPGKILLQTGTIFHRRKLSTYQFTVSSLKEEENKKERKRKRIGKKDTLSLN